jgi:hypothetical protein
MSTYRQRYQTIFLRHRCSDKISQSVCLLQALLKDFGKNIHILPHSKGKHIALSPDIKIDLNTVVRDKHFSL